MHIYAGGRIRGKVRMDRRTKNLFSRLEQGDLAVIDHADLDEVAAEGLLKRKVKAVINTRPFITGHYPNRGPALLMEKGIPLLELPDDGIFSLVREGETLELRGSRLLKGRTPLAEGAVLTGEGLAGRLKEASGNTARLLDEFVQNTLEFAKREKHLILGGVEIPGIRTRIQGRHVLVVVRGRNYRQDLKAILTYIEERKPVLVGVDGGSDALLEFGLKPDIIIGDMDSVSDEALRQGKEIILHAYTDGRAPGAEKCRSLGLSYRLFRAPGTSEDIALLLAYEKGAELIVALGTHSNMIDFLEKGRPGMASTFLIRLKVGSRLVDARGVSQLYEGRYQGRLLWWLVAAAVLPVVLMILFSPLLQHLLRLLILRIRLLF